MRLLFCQHATQLLYKVHVQTTTSDFDHVFYKLEYYVHDVFSSLLIEFDFN